MLKMTCLAAATLLAAAVTATAQSAVLPFGFANVEGTSSSAYPFGRGNSACRAQYIYDSSNWTLAGINYPITIHTIHFRANGGATTAGGTHTSVDFRMGLATNDYNSLTTNFDNNYAGGAPAFQATGPVTVAAGAGQLPNNFYVALPVTPFVYDPTLGQDLVIEIRFAAGTFTGTSANTSASSVDLASGAGVALGSRVFSSSATAVTGSYQTNLSHVVKMDYTEPPGVAKRTQYGTGCYDQQVSFYENFGPGTFDLGSATGTNSIRMTPNGLGGYTVTPGSNQWYTSTSPSLTLSAPGTTTTASWDDAVSVGLPMSFNFNHPGGSTNTIFVGSNGHIWLTAAGATTPTGTSATLLGQGARLSPYWTDLDPASGGTLHFDDDAPNGVVYVTWLAVPMWEAVPSVPPFLSTVQAAIYNTGVVEFRYQACSAPTYNIITGYTPGGGARDPGSRDLSTAMPFSTAADIPPLALSASARPVLGVSLTIDTTNVPASAILSATILSFTKHDPGLDLTGLGMPGCFQYVGLDATHVLFGTPSVSLPMTMPTNPSWIGAEVVCQTASLVPGVNALGAISSNGLSLLLGNL